jgi:Na+/melibiose symporter-like transporter
VGIAAHRTIAHGDRQARDGRPRRALRFLDPRMLRKIGANRPLIVVLVFFLLMYLVPGNLLVALVGICLSYFFLSVPYALFFGLVPDTVEYGEWKTGLRA